MIAELLARGHFDPFFPFEIARRMAADRPVGGRGYEAQAEWEAEMAEAVGLAPREKAWGPFKEAARA